MGGMGLNPFVNLCHLLCGVPHGGSRGLGSRSNAFRSAGFGPCMVAQLGRQPGVCQDCTPIDRVCLSSAGKSTSQLLANFYRKHVAVGGQRNAQVALRSSWSTSKTYRPTPHPIVFHEDNFNFNSPRFDV